MPSAALIAYCLLLIAKTLPNFLSALRSLGVAGSLVVILSGCNAVGTSRPAALQVTSNPEASVFLDGKHLGKTPFFSDQLKAGEHLLKITVSQASFVNQITLTAGTLTVVDRDLVDNFLAQAGEILYLVPDQKGLFVSSQPADADLVIDGRYRGKTPAFIAEIDQGEHKIQLSKQNYLQREFSIKTVSKYQLIAQVTLASEIAKGVSPTVSIPSPPPVQKVEILQTPQGFLRVRQEPDQSSLEIGRVSTGDQLELIQETKDWLKIKFAGKFGWIASQYTKKI